MLAFKQGVWKQEFLQHSWFNSTTVIPAFNEEKWKDLHSTRFLFKGIDVLHFRGSLAFFETNLEGKRQISTDSVTDLKEYFFSVETLKLSKKIRCK